MTIKKITMPKLGESVTEGTINEWFVQVGDRVNKYDPIAEVMTDKVNAEIPSSYTGVIEEVIVTEGDTVTVGDIICTMKVTEAATSVDEEPKVETKLETTTEEKETSMRHRYSPAVLRLAQENDIDLTKLTGTGLGGRITRKDVEAYMKSGKQSETAIEREPQLIREETRQPLEDDEIVPLQGVRKAIADKMTLSKREIPHAWLKVEADVTDLVQYRENIKDNFKRREGHSLTYFAFFVYAVARALREYPELNATWQDGNIVRHKEINLSIAVAKDNELYVPVIKRADEMSIAGIAKEIERLATKARTTGLDHEDMVGGTFTVNNTGTFGSVASMGIINYPQVAILQVESIVKRPVIIDNMFAPRDIVNLCLSLDHRVLDGLICGRFLARVKKILQAMNKNTAFV